MTNTTLPDLKRITAQVGMEGAQHLPKPHLVNAIIAKESVGSAAGRVQALLNQTWNQVPKPGGRADERYRSPVGFADVLLDFRSENQLSGHSGCGLSA